MQKVGSFTYEDIGPDYFGHLLCGKKGSTDMLFCEKSIVSTEHGSNRMIARWRVGYRLGDRRCMKSFVAKKFDPGLGGEIPKYKWLHANTDVNLPPLIDYRYEPEQNNCWMLTENWVNHRDPEFDRLNRFYSMPDGAPCPQTDVAAPYEGGFLLALADLHGKTLWLDWGETDLGPLDVFHPSPRIHLSIDDLLRISGNMGITVDDGLAGCFKTLAALLENLPARAVFERLAKHTAIAHGALNLQEVGFRFDSGFKPKWCLFDYETCYVAPIYFDLAQVHYGIGKTIDDSLLTVYVEEVQKHSGIELRPEVLREGIDVAVIFLGPQMVCSIVKYYGLDALKRIVSRIESSARNSRK